MYVSVQKLSHSLWIHLLFEDNYVKKKKKRNNKWNKVRDIIYSERWMFVNINYKILFIF